MLSITVLPIIFLLLSREVFCKDDGLQWVDYNGVIPETAVVGGYDKDGNDIYIGQAKVPGTGIAVGSIYPDIPTINITDIDETPRTISSNIKILCDHNPLDNPVSWIRANSENLHVHLIGQKAVVGGYFENLGLLNIGRISYDNAIQIGPIRSYNLERAKLNFVFDGKVKQAGFFEILVDDMGLKRRRNRRKGLKRNQI